MLSILIPTYNYGIVSLVNELHKQCTECNIEFEIICIDDGSFSLFNNENEKINALNNCIYFSNEQNIGLSSNRNLLVATSKYEYVLFIDGDSIIIDKNYINNYLKAIKGTDEIIYGGRIHPKTQTNVNKRLRWKYGKYIEDKLALTRKKNIYKTLIFNNTLVKKNIFSKLKFDSSIKEYGHEDTLLAFQINLLKLKVSHIDNAIMHGDIDNNESFINKTERALANILILYNNHKISHKFVKILWLYDIMGTLKLNGLMAFLFDKIKQNLKKQLLSKNPSLILFQIYKIGYLCSLKNVSKEI